MSAFFGNNKPSSENTNLNLVDSSGAGGANSSTTGSTNLFSQGRYKQYTSPSALFGKPTATPNACSGRPLRRKILNHTPIMLESLEAFRTELTVGFRTAPVKSQTGTVQLYNFDLGNLSNNAR